MTDALLERLTAAPRKAKLAPIPWPDGLDPKPQRLASHPNDRLPNADVLVVTWTEAEKQALADVLTPGMQYASWDRYREHWSDYETQFTWKSPARADEHCLGSYALTLIGTKRVLCFGSNLHLATDATSAPIVQLWQQMIVEVKPQLVITTGTAGGIGQAEQLGDVFIVNSAKFNCTKAFRDKPWAQQRFDQGPGLSVGPHIQVATEQLIPVNAGQLKASGLITRPSTIWASTGDVETVDYFGFDDTDDSYGIVKDDPQAKTEEMDDATLPLALSQLQDTSLPGWLSIRNASDPMVPSSIGSLEEQSKWASAIYSRFGYWTTVNSALAVWAVIADL